MPDIDPALISHARPARGLAVAGMLAALTLAAPAAAPADTRLSENGSNVAALDDVVVWAQVAADRTPSLVARIAGANRKLPLRPFFGGGPGVIRPDADLGRDRKGRLVATYPRCTGVGRPFDCDLFSYRFDSREESKLKGASTSTYIETAPSFWSRTYVFARDRRNSRSRRGEGLVRYTSSRKRLERMPTSETDTRDNIVAWIGVENRRRDVLWVQRATSRRSCRIRTGRFGRDGSSRSLFSPQIEGGYVYWMEDRRLSNGRAGGVRVYRQRIPAADCDRRGRLRKSSKSFPQTGAESPGTDSFGVDDGAIYYSTGGRGVFLADDPAPFGGT